VYWGALYLFLADFEKLPVEGQTEAENIIGASLQLL
jgi:hypothetical protein